MPITQNRMLAVIRAANEMNSLRMAQLKAFEELIDNIASGRIESTGIYAAFHFLKSEFIPSAEAITAIVKETEHFRHSAARNVRMAAKMEARRRAKVLDMPMPKGEVPQKRWGITQEDREAGLPIMSAAEAEKALTEEIGPQFEKGREGQATTTLAPQASKVVGAASEAMAKGNLKGTVEYDDSTPEDPDQF